jgi:NAD(P)-dependent dehydrogenase (short-subunit alcohol dehydrogenase family)
VSATKSALLVTGASTGIGAATAQSFARDGWLVYAGVRNEADAVKAASWDANVRPVLLDVTDRAAIATALEEIARRDAPLRAVVCNAGIAIGGPLEFLPVDELRRIFEVNVFGAVAVAQASLPQLRATQGRLVFVGSISGRLAMPLMGPYSASKFALRAIAEAWRQELASANVAVTLIEPGSVKTPIWEKGRASRGRLLALLGPEGVRRYGEALEGIFAATEIEERNGMPVERVAAVIHNAIVSPRPRASYVVGGSAKAGSILAMLPARLRDAALRRALGRPLSRRETS